MIRYLIFIFFILSSPVLLSQQQSVDSLEKAMLEEPLPKKIDRMAYLGLYYHLSGNPKGMKYAKEAVSLARSQKDKKYGTYAYSSLMLIYSQMDSVSLAYSMMDTCLWYADQSTDIKVKIKALNSVTITKDFFNDKDNIPDILLQGLDLARQIPEDDHERWEIESKLYFSLYNYYCHTDHELTKKYLDKSMDAMSKLDVPVMKILRLNGYTHYYKTIYETDKSNIAALDSAIQASDRAIGYYMANSEKIVIHNYVEVLLDRAEVYLMKNELDSATHYSNKMIEESIKVGDAQYESEGYNLLSKIELKKNRLNLAEELALKALRRIDTETGTHKNLYELNTNLSAIYKAAGKHQQALAASEEAFEYFKKDKNETYLREAQVANAKYKVQQSKYELEQSKKENQLYFFYLIISITLFIALILLIVLYRFRLRNAKQKELILAKDKEEAELKEQIQQNKAAKLSIEKQNIELQLEVEKSQALLKAYEVNKLQKELLAGNLQLDYKNEIIGKIKSELEKNSNVHLDTAQIERLLKDEKKNDSKFDEFIDYVRKIHPTFYSMLQEQAKQNLTPLDLRYCTFIFMNLSSKDISSLLYIEPKTVRMTKYRLKQKLDLSKEDDLSLFIQQLI